MMIKITIRMEEISTMTKIMDIRAKADTTAKADMVMANNKTSATIYLTNTEMEIMVMVSNVVMVKMIHDLMDPGTNSFSVNNSVKNRQIFMFF